MIRYTVHRPNDEKRVASTKLLKNTRNHFIVDEPCTLFPFSLENLFIYIVSYGSPKLPAHICWNTNNFLSGRQQHFVEGSHISWVIATFSRNQQTFQLEAPLQSFPQFVACILIFRGVAGVLYSSNTAESWYWTQHSQSLGDLLSFLP